MNPFFNFRIVPSTNSKPTLGIVNGKYVRYDESVGTEADFYELIEIQPSISIPETINLVAYDEFTNTKTFIQASSFAVPFTQVISSTEEWCENYVTKISDEIIDQWIEFKNNQNDTGTN